jgi:hypothetical protein
MRSDCGNDPVRGVASSWVIAMIERTLWLTWRKGTLAVVVCAGLIFVHFVLERLFHLSLPLLLLPAAIFPLWAISAAVYTFDITALSPSHGRRHPR